MKKTRYTDSQIISILKQNESGTFVAELCREHGMSQASFYKWRSKYGGMDMSLMKRLKKPFSALWSSVKLSMPRS